MNPTITVFERSPDRGAGLSRDVRVRWALEEVGQPYDVRLVSFAAMKEPEHRTRNPFGQIPAFEEGEYSLFESGSIVFHIAETHPGLLPTDPVARSRAVTWMFAALTTVEAPILELSSARINEANESWAEARMPLVVSRVHARLRELSAWLGDREWLEDEFTAGDLIMVHVLQRLKRSGLLNEYPNIAAYVARAEARPAFQRAFAAQLKLNAEPAPAA